MNTHRRRELVAALGAALVVVFVHGREASAERLYTERPAELRSSPGDDSQVVRRVGKGKALEVVKRLGTWVMVEYEGRTGWIRRTALSTEPVSGGSAGDADDDQKDAKKDKKKKDKSDDTAADDDSSVEPKAAAGGAKKTAAKKKAERKKSRKSRHSADKASDDEQDQVADDEGEDVKTRRPRSTWAARGRLPGGPLKVEIQALSVQAFSEPDGSGKVVFTVAEGDRVRVIARGENRWLLVENGKKRTGWIPAFAVRDNGLLPEARKDVAASDDDAGADDAEEASSADEKESDRPSRSGKSKSGKSKKTRTADASDVDESSDEGESSSRSSSDDAEATLSGSSDDEMADKPKPWTLTGSVHAGFTAVGMDVTPTGQTAETASYNGPIAGLSGELMYRIRPKIGILFDLDYDFATALGGLTVSPEGGEDVTDISLTTHRVGASAGVAYGKRATGSLRLGYQYAIFQISDIDNGANWPRESTSGPTAGLGFQYPELAGKLGMRVGLDAMLFGTRSQTEGSRDGDLDSLTALWATLRVDYPVGKNLVIDGGYRFGYASASWTGTSDRNGATATDRKDQAHEISVGAGWRL
ncbi:MAG TPA: SH3 domain-containing protein [Kofleriaceae bacterium]|nr:SH3 domain-containing protein [Kofleriaceae bacterium]